MTQTATIAGYILRAADREETAAFYRLLGLTLHLHEHGGPAHFELGPTNDGCVTEIYRRTTNLPTDALMVKVPSLNAALCACGSTAPVRDVGTMRLAYVTDPDGRLVMVYEEISPSGNNVKSQEIAG